MKEYELAGDQYFVRRIPGATQVIVNGTAGTLMRLDLLQESRSSFALPPDLLERGGGATNLLVRADGKRMMVTDDDLGLCWEGGADGWGQASELPNSNTATDLCYLWSERLILRKNFGGAYYAWDRDASTGKPRFERANAIFVRRDHPLWLAGVESFPPRDCHVHRTWQDTCDLVYYRYAKESQRIGYVSWSRPETSWSRPVSSVCLRMAALPNWIFVLADRSDQRREICVIGRDGTINTIHPPDGYSFNDLDTVANDSYTGLVLLAAPWGPGPSKLQLLPFG